MIQTGLRLVNARARRGLFWSAAFALPWLLSGNALAQTPFRLFTDAFVRDVQLLDLPQPAYDYRDYFNAVPSNEKLEAQLSFFNGVDSALRTFNVAQLAVEDRTAYRHIAYETTFNLKRIGLEKSWVKAGRVVPVGGLAQLAHGKDWYAWFVKRYTSTDISPEDVYRLGLAEVARVKKEIARLQVALGYNDSVAFYKHLGESSFFITDKQQVIAGFHRIDSVVRTRLGDFAGPLHVPPVYPMEWPDANANTPPGIYLNNAYNPYGKDVFQFNFYNKRYNRRAMEWLYMHEAIPGHHLQFSFREPMPLDDLFYYPGNFEGWACYVEYLGDDLGLYTDPYAALGKWEWDLVRSARLVIDAGIHYYGWTREQALEYWRKTIPGQDDIAEREVTRVTNWAGQALSYKVGADFIFKMRDAWQRQNPHAPVSDFHKLFLSAGSLPLLVLEQKLFAADVK